MPSQRNNLAQLALRWVRSALAVATAALLLGLFASETQASILSPGITEIDASELLESHFLGVDALGEHLDQLSEPTEDEGMAHRSKTRCHPPSPSREKSGQPKITMLSCRVLALRAARAPLLPRPSAQAPGLALLCYPLVRPKSRTILRWSATLLSVRSFCLKLLGRNC